MILEGLVTTVDVSGALNVAPMGPKFEEGRLCRPDRLVLRPFKSARTYRNLLERQTGVFHVTDDVLAVAKAAIGLADMPTVLATHVSTPRLLDCCRFHEFEVDAIDDAQERTTIGVRVVHSQTVREFSGFNRGKHAVLEAAILATRLHLMDKSIVLHEFERLRPLVDKTGGSDEHEAFALLLSHVEALD